MTNSAIIELQNVSSKSHNLHKIDLELHSNQILAVVGKPNSGKYQLIECLTLSIQGLDEGKIICHQKDFLALSLDEQHMLMRQIGYITTNPTFIENKTVYENIELCFKLLNIKPHVAAEKIQQLMKITEIASKQDTLVSNLNLWQKIKLDITRKLASQPRLLIGIDLQNNLDATTSRKLDQLIQQLTNELNLSWVLITNDPITIKNICHKIIMMQDSTIIEELTPLELFTKPNSDVGKDYLKYITKQELPINIKDSLQRNVQTNNKMLLRIATKANDNFNNHLPETLANFELNINIISAYKDTINQTVIYVMLVTINLLSADETEFYNALLEHDIYSENIGYVDDIY